LYGRKCTSGIITVKFLQCAEGEVTENRFQGCERKGIKKPSSRAQPEETKSGLTIQRAF
jgi:hypothetical protein